jgi:hypothetical protein
MAAPAMTAQALIELLKAKAAAPPPEANEIFVRHLKCKESIALSRIVSEAMDRCNGNDSPPLVPPTELLPPLG